MALPGSVDLESVDQRTFTIRFPLQPTDVADLGGQIMQAGREGYELRDAEEVHGGHQRDPYVTGVRLRLVRAKVP